MRPRWLVLFAIGLATLSRFYLLDVLPPQVWFDEIWFALKAREFLQTQQVPAYYGTYWGGVHPLMVLLTAAVQALGLNSPIASRVISAASGILSVPLAYACFNELWRDLWTPERRRITAALAALVLSNLLSYLVVSRVGLEWSLDAALTLCCVWLYHRAQRTGRWALWAPVGLIVGGSQYLSQHMRFLIPLVGLYLVDDWARAGSGKRAALVRRAGLLGLVALLTALPLIAFFVREPQWLVARAGIITRPEDQSYPAFLLGNVWRVALSFVVSGSRATFDNVPGRPLLDVLQAIGFAIGVLWAVVQVKRPPARKMLVWMAVMAAPSILTEGAPSFERMVNLVPAAAALVAVGWVSGWQWLTDRVRAPRWLRASRWVRAPRWVRASIAVCWVIASLGINAHAYFVRYPASPTLRRDYTAGITALTRQLIDRSHAEPVFVERITEATNALYFDYLLPGTPVHYLDYRQCLPLSTDRATRTTYLVNAERDPQRVEELARLYPQAQVTAMPSESSWLIDDVALIEVPAQTPLSIDLLAGEALFEPGIRLLGYTWSGPRVKAGESLFVTLYWEALAAVGADYTAFMHVGTGAPDLPLIAQHDAQPCQGFYPTSRWRAGDAIPDSFAITLPADTPPGDYPLVVGWYHYPSFERLSLISAGEPLPENRAVLATLEVTP